MLWLGRALLATRGRDHWRAGSAGAAGNAGWKSRLPDGAGVWTCHERGLHGPAVHAGVGVGRRAARRARSERAERAEAGLDLLVLNQVLNRCSCVVSVLTHVSIQRYMEVCATHISHAPLHEIQAKMWTYTLQLPAQMHGVRLQPIRWEMGLHRSMVFVDKGEESHGVRVVGTGLGDPSIVLHQLGTNGCRIIEGRQKTCTLRRGRVAPAHPGVGQGWWSWGKGAK